MGLVQAGMTYINYNRKAKKLPTTAALTPAATPVSTPRSGGDYDLENQPDKKSNEKDLTEELLNVVGGGPPGPSNSDHPDHKPHPYSPPNLN